ncbi:hypothetical protein [Streptosporangium sp. NPDC087985]|uniref:hypothetical protein n=1 Tax=Streptosporangium sp. NPDC087985 TaxID=3366196 RepID=UPI0037F9CD18
MIRRRPARPRGRHRSGLALSAVPSYTWDHGARAEAVRLGAAWPGWAVLYGTGSRLFYAIATWPTPEPLIVSDRTPDGLQALMNEAETARAATRRQAPTSAPAGAVTQHRTSASTPAGVGRP